MLKISKVWGWAGMVAFVSLAGCSNTPIYPPAPTLRTPYDWNYLIGPGDNVNVFVWRNPEVSGAFPVRPDGKMTMNLVEDMPASGKTPSQLARDIEKALAGSWSTAACNAVKMKADNLNSDLHASAEYRAHLIPVIAGRAAAAAK